tara:strand:- start:166 stop:504 length:339 start_codon:yes stop_codon:yes gene_type:complete
MSPKRKTKGRKRRTIRKRLSSVTRGAKRRLSAAARYARENPEKFATGVAGVAGVTGAGALGLKAYSNYDKLRRREIEQNKEIAMLKKKVDSLEEEKNNLPNFISYYYLKIKY